MSYSYAGCSLGLLESDSSPAAEACRRGGWLWDVSKGACYYGGNPQSCEENGGTWDIARNRCNNPQRESYCTKTGGKWDPVFSVCVPSKEGAKVNAIAATVGATIVGGSALWLLGLL